MNDQARPLKMKLCMTTMHFVTENMVRILIFILTVDCNSPYVRRQPQLDLGLNHLMELVVNYSAYT